MCSKFVANVLLVAGMSNRKIFDEFMANVLLVAGMSNREIFDEFMVIGGTELSLMRCVRACARSWKSVGPSPE